MTTSDKHGLAGFQYAYVMGVVLCAVAAVFSYLTSTQGAFKQQAPNV